MRAYKHAYTLMQCTEFALGPSLCLLSLIAVQDILLSTSHEDS